jgi:hypothetical protein
MSRQDKTRLDVLLTTYLRSQFDFNTTQFIERGKTLDSNGITMFEYTIYDLPNEHLRVGLFAHEYFEDMQSAFGDGSKASQGNSVNFKSVGRQIWALDWSDIKKGVAMTNSVQREYRNGITAQANSFYSKAMKLNTFEYDLRSVTWDVELGDFNRHLIFKNFSSNAPIMHYQAPTGLTTS